MKGSILFVICAVCFLSFPVVGAQTVLHVQTGSSIQAAIDRAAPGTVIELGPGTWRENLRIDKAVVINGAGAERTAIAGKEAGYPVVWITSTQTGSLTITGVAISGAFGKECAEKANKVCTDGILVQGKAKLMLSDCRVEGNALHGLYASGNVRVFIGRTTVSQNYSGIWLSAAAHAQIDAAEISRNAFGLVLAERSLATVTGCTISGNTHDGVLAADATGLILNNNRITNNGRVGVCVDEWPCYTTKRVFTGSIHGRGNTIPSPREKDGNVNAAICPTALRFLSSETGGIYPVPNPESLFGGFPIPPPLEGNPHAPVTIIEFSDFTCPYCARFARDTLPKLRANYIEPGKVRLFFLPYPVHGAVAEKEAEAGFCAQAQGCFWKFHDRMFADLFVHGFPNTFDPVRVRAIAAAAGCDPGAISGCLSSGTYAAAVQESISIAHKLGVEGTPTFFIDGMEVFGAAPYAVFARIIDSELAAAQPSSP